MPSRIALPAWAPQPRTGGSPAVTPIGNGLAGNVANSGSDFGSGSVPSGPSYIPNAQPSDAAQAISTVADAYLAALGSQPANPGATVVVPTPPADSGGSVNIKGLAIIAAIAIAAWFAWKKWGKKAADA